MATDTIGSDGGRDFADINAWSADLPATLLEQEIGDMFNDSEFATTTEQATPSITTTAAFNLVIRAASGEGFADDAGASTNALQYDASLGVAMRKTDNYGQVLDLAAGENAGKNKQGMRPRRRRRYQEAPPRRPLP